MESMLKPSIRKAPVTAQTAPESLGRGVHIGFISHLAVYPLGALDYSYLGLLPVEAWGYALLFTWSLWAGAVSTAKKRRNQETEG